MPRRILTYGFPFYLLAIEYVLRSALEIGENRAMGPTLAAVGVALLLSLINPKDRTSEFSDKIVRELKQAGAFISSIAEHKFIQILWIAIFVMLGSWTYCLYLSYRPPDPIFWGLPEDLVIGLMSYFFGVGFAEVKERL